MLPKPITEVTLDDLNDLLGVAESDRLEFKQAAYGPKDEDKREMLRDITSFANAAGGYLLLGIEEDDQERASQILGIAEAEQQATAMLSSCRANIEEQIIGLNFHLVPVSDNAQVLIWYIPRSTRAPHMITFKGLYQCWKRHGRQKDRMSIEEIREACVRTENIRRSLEDFLSERRQKVLDQVDSEPWLWLTVTPLVVRDELIDTGDEALRHLMERQPYQREGGGGWTTECGADIRPSLYGLAAELADVRRLEVFRNGHVEFRVEIDTDSFCRESFPGPAGEQRLVMDPYPLAEYPLSFMHLVRALLDHAAIMEPIVVGLTIFNAPGLGLRYGRPGTVGYGSEPREQIPTWRDDQHLQVPLMQFPHPVDPAKVAQRLVDRVWNAFTYHRCSVLTEDGQLLVRRR